MSTGQQSKPMKILLTGPSGQIGHELVATLPALGEVVAVDRAQMDLTNPDQIHGVLDAVRPDLVVNAAAYTAVDRAEVETQVAFSVNATAVRFMADALGASGAMLVHFSTDYVFDGTKRAPYVEEDRTNPLNAYGRSKLEGEKAIRASGVPHLILRTSWVYGARGRNFLTAMLGLFEEKEELRVVDDQIGAPTWCRWIAQATAGVLERCFAGGALRRELTGTYHMTASGSTSWYGFAVAIREQRYGAGATRPVLTAVPARAYAVAAKRPSNSVMSNDRLRKAFGIEPPDWRDRLAECFKDMTAEPL